MVFLARTDFRLHPGVAGHRTRPGPGPHEQTPRRVSCLRAACFLAHLTTSSAMATAAGTVPCRDGVPPRRFASHRVEHPAPLDPAQKEQRSLSVDGAWILGAQYAFLHSRTTGLLRTRRTRLASPRP